MVLVCFKLPPSRRRYVYSRHVYIQGTDKLLPKNGASCDPSKSTEGIIYGYMYGTLLFCHTTYRGWPFDFWPFFYVVGRVFLGGY